MTSRRPSAVTAGRAWLDTPGSVSRGCGGRANHSTIWPASHRTAASPTAHRRHRMRIARLRIQYEHPRSPMRVFPAVLEGNEMSPAELVAGEDRLGDYYGF